MTEINKACNVGLDFKYLMRKALPLGLLICAVFFTTSCKAPTKAKPEPDIAGVYDTSGNGDPQGGGALYVLPDHRFVMIFFGGAAMGTWEINGDDVLFKSKTKPKGFRIYGRHNNKLGNNIQVFFDGFDTYGGAAIGFDASTKNVKQVFNDAPNCTERPTVGKFSGIPQNIVLAAHPVDENGTIEDGSAWRVYTFDNKNKDNDFIAEYNPEGNHERLQNFRGEIKDGKLDFDKKGSAKKPFPGAREMEPIYKFLNIPLEPESVFYNAHYTMGPENLEEDTLNYRFNIKKDAYINFRNYVEGEENKPQKKGSDDYDNLNVVYRYRKLTSTKTSGQVNLDAKPIFTAKCKQQ